MTTNIPQRIHKDDEINSKHLKNDETERHTRDKDIRYATQMTQKNFEEIRAAFNLFDKDGNGYITVSELRQYLTSLGYNMTEAELMDMMNTIDADGNGAIDFPEFLVLTTKKVHVFSEEELARETFNVFDRTHKGHITTDDLQHMLRALGQHFSDSEIRDMVCEADFDRDGLVSFQDFTKMMNIKLTDS